jgi:hypothetical protein
MRKGYLALVAAALALLASTAVRADYTLYMTFQGVVPSYSVGVHNEDDPVRHISTQAGAYRYNVAGGGTAVPLLLNPGHPTDMFCLDLVSYAATGTYELVAPAFAPVTSTGTPDHFPMGSTRALWLRALATMYWNSTLDTDVEWAAMQLAVWEIVYEGDGENAPALWSASAGEFHVDDQAGQGAVALADTMLADLATAVNTPGATLESLAVVHLGALVNDTRQDMLVRTVREVPEPSVMALAGLGLLGLFTRRRKRS